MASTAPLRISRPSRFTPDIRVCAVKGTNTGFVRGQFTATQTVLLFCQHNDRSAFRSFVGERCKLRRIRHFRRGNSGSSNELRCLRRLPSVIVPVLSSNNVFTSPAASTARPDIASTLCCTSRSMPAMPIAESRPPMVVGIRHTSSETSTNTVWGEPDKLRMAVA